MQSNEDATRVHEGDCLIPPGPEGAARVRLLWRFLTAGGNVPETIDPPLFEQLRSEYGPIIRVKTPVGADWYVITDPGHVKHILESNHQNFRKDPRQIAELETLFGNGLVTQEGDSWQRHKRPLAPLFTGWRDELGDDIATEVNEATREWVASDSPVTLNSETSVLVFDILGKRLFGEHFESQRADLLAGLKTIKTAFPRESSPIPTAPEWLPTPHTKRMDKIESKINGAIEELIDRHRNSPLTTDSVLSGLLAAADGDLNESEIRDELKTALIGGMVTSDALFWTLYSLAAHPDIQQELSRQLHEGDGTGYLNQVIHETLRLYPPLPPVVRTPIRSDIIGGFEIPSGARLLINQAPIHRDPDLWTDPRSFHPTRFDDGWVNRKPRYAYYPFGGGPRTCVGRTFAYAILTAVVTELVSRYQLRIRGEHDRVVDRFASFSRDICVSISRRPET